MMRWTLATSDEIMMVYVSMDEHEASQTERKANNKMPIKLTLLTSIHVFRPTIRILLIIFLINITAFLPSFTVALYFLA